MRHDAAAQGTTLIQGLQAEGNRGWDVPMTPESQLDLNLPESDQGSLPNNSIPALQTQDRPLRSSSSVQLIMQQFQPIPGDWLGLS